MRFYKVVCKDSNGWHSYNQNDKTTVDEKPRNVINSSSLARDSSVNLGLGLFRREVNLRLQSIARAALQQILSREHNCLLALNILSDLEARLVRASVSGRE